MGKEVLYVPEEDLQQVIRIIRAGLAQLILADDIDPGVWESLRQWCVEEERYLARVAAAQPVSTGGDEMPVGLA